MIKTTTRLSRGARLRRGAPIWIFVILTVGSLVGALVLVLFLTS